MVLGVGIGSLALTSPLHAADPVPGESPAQGKPATPAAQPGTTAPSTTKPSDSPKAADGETTEDNADEITVTERRTATATHDLAGATKIPSRAIERNPAPPNFNSVIGAYVPGATALPNGAIRIRGSDNQFSYYLDGAPLPANVSAFITDQINPKNIERLRVYTGAFPAAYGGQLSAVFDATAKAGRAGQPEGLLQQLGGNFSTYDTTLQYGSGVRLKQGKELSYFVSGFRSTTDFRLSPISPTPLHNDGRETLGFGKFDYQWGPVDRLTLHIGGQNARLQVPNSPERQAAGQDNNQLEDKGFTNLIWRHAQGENLMNLALYSHTSQSRFLGSPQDLVPTPLPGGDDDELISVNQNQRVNYTGLRGDYTLAAKGSHQAQVGFDVNRAQGRLAFSLESDPAEGFDPLLDNRKLKGSNYGAYVQDTWKSGRATLNYGARFDVHRSDNTYSQLSPRLNGTYSLSDSNTLYAFYNRLFMPVPVESIRRLSGDSAIGDLTISPIVPERDDYFGLGWQRRAGKSNFRVDAYYKAIKNIVDNQEVGDTLIEVPINEAKGRVSGVEFSLDRTLSKRLTAYASYGLSRGQASGPVSGGLSGLEELPPGYFIDDHDRTHVAAMNLTYDGKKTYALITGEFASGLPFGELKDANGDPIVINFNRSPSYFILNAGIGHRFRNGFELAFNVNNLLDNKYIIAEDNLFRRSIYGQRRNFSVKAGWNF